MSDGKYTLFYFPTSYFSQKALLALFEKEIYFKRWPIDIQNGCQLDPWYMRLNPNGNVPTLQHGDRLFVESDDILRYLDQQVPRGPTLFPETSSPVGKQVAEWYEELNAIPIEYITFGVIVNREKLSVSGVKVPPFVLKINGTKEAVIQRFSKSKEKARENAERYPDLREQYLTKSNARDDLYSGKSLSLDTASKNLDDLEPLFDKIQNQLHRTKEAQGSANIWLVGSAFTAADIMMVIFLDRLNFIGVLERYCGPTKRTLVYDYFNRLANRNSVQKTRAQVKDAAKVLISTKLKQIMPGVLGLASALLAVGLGFYYLKRRTLE